jgi:hypothetical protein
VAPRYRRFALHDVTFAGLAMPGATIDCWEDAEGHPCWGARVVTRSSPAVDEGELRGLAADGRVVSGHVRVTGRQDGEIGRRETVVVFSGSGTLHGR